MVNLKDSWRELCDAYLRAFCEKHEYDYDDAYWVGDDPGTIACVADIFVGMDEMRYDIDADVPEELFLKWYDYSLEVHEAEMNWRERHKVREFVHINYPSFCKGAPLPYSKKQLADLGYSYESAERCIEMMSEVVGTDILVRSRDKILVYARYMVAYYLREFGFSYHEIGNFLNMNHATIIHGVKMIKEMLSYPQMYQEETKIWQKFLSLQKQ